MEFANNK